ncbi:unnamed protein product [Phytophthora fragariaefolia]|uniref:Unnamed protein product n=1 Tax=Phytophthora fragariaefolia TaxID=1490495 RepID=A0A9W6TRB2_9STRA|nr:unnamed protein product [Phytophthora fragariaefolia]
MENDSVNTSGYTEVAPVVPALEAWVELDSARRSFVDYCRALWDPIPIAVTKVVSRFVNTLKGWQQCDAADLPLIVTWIDTLLDRYRKAAMCDIFHVSTTRSEAPTWSLVSNPELHALIITTAFRQLLHRLI